MNLYINIILYIYELFLIFNQEGQKRRLGEHPSLVSCWELSGTLGPLTQTYHIKTCIIITAL